MKPPMLQTTLQTMQPTVLPVMKHCGMTLIEVMMALTIFSIAGLATLKATSGQINTAVYLEQKTLATWVADNVIQQLRLDKTWPELGWKTQKATLGEQTWYVRYRGGEMPVPQMRKIEVEVHATEDHDRALAIQSTFVTR